MSSYYPAAEIQLRKERSLSICLFILSESPSFIASLCSHNIESLKAAVSAMGLFCPGFCLTYTLPYLIGGCFLGAIHSLTEKYGGPDTQIALSCCVILCFYVRESKTMI